MMTTVNFNIKSPVRPPHGGCLFVVLLILSAPFAQARQGVPGSAKPVELQSPDAGIRMQIVPGRALHSLISYNVSGGLKNIIRDGSLQLSIDQLPVDDLIVQNVTKTALRSSWKAVYGERKLIPENYNGIEILFTSTSVPSLKIAVTVRAYNEGIAYRYRILNKKFRFTVTGERAVFPLEHGAVTWVSNRAQSPITAKPVNAVQELADRPVTVRTASALFLAIGEAALVNYGRMKFIGDVKGTLTGRLTDTVSQNDSVVSPWRYMIVGKTPGALLEKNYLLLNLNQPDQLNSNSWIRPGKVLRETTLTTGGAVNCIDFAARHGISYISFDAGWYGREDSDTSDATRVSVDPARSKGPLDLQKVIAYGRTKNIGVILYVNRRALERQLDTILPLYESWGIKGIKFGFVQVGNQKWTNWLHEAIRKAANYHMIVDIHDEYRPTGYSRTYPNLLTQEGIRGDEESPNTEHTITTLFTRMIAGAADNTNCYFTDRVSKMGSRAAQMAKTVCIYSPLQFLYWYDKPVPVAASTIPAGVIRELPELKWFDEVPVSWDETRVLESDMEKFATIARRKDNSWYVGSLTGTNPRQLSLSLSFLRKNKTYIATIYSDSPEPRGGEYITIKKIIVNSNTVIHQQISARGGLAIMIRQK